MCKIHCTSSDKGTFSKMKNKSLTSLYDYRFPPAIGLTYLEFTIDFSARAVYRQGVFKRIESLGLFTRDDPTKRLPSTTLNPSKDGNFVGMRYASSKTPPRSLISNIYDASVRV